MRRMFAGFGMLAVAATLPMAGPAQAADKPPPIPIEWQSYSGKGSNLSKADKRHYAGTFQALLADAKAQAGASPAYLPGGCNTRGYKFTDSNIYGVALWSYFQAAAWCWGDGVLSSVSRSAWGEIYVWPWNDATPTPPGWIAEFHSGGPGYTWGWKWTKGHFCVAVPGGPWCVNDAYPHVEINVLPGGGSSAAAGWE